MTLARRHQAGLVLAGAVVAAPLWFATLANAADPVVTFHGRPLVTSSTVSCPSRPDTLALTVLPGATVDFVNHLGIAATLSSGGSHQDLDNGDTVPVTFATAGPPITIEMVPKCILDVGEHVAMTVTVAVPPATASPSPSATAPGGVAAPPPTASPTKAVSPRSAAGVKHAGQTKHARKHSGTPTPSRSPLISVAGNGGDAAPAGGVPSAESADTVYFGEPISATRSPSGASGLLTLIATVSVGGVTAAVIRAIVAHRATRSLTS